MARKFVVEITAKAAADLAAIHEWIAQDDARAAARFMARVRSRGRSLARFPQRGAVIPEAELLGVPYRHVIEGAYRFIYRIDDQRVVVVRVIHGARLPSPG